MGIKAMEWIWSTPCPCAENVQRFLALCFEQHPLGINDWGLPLSKTAAYQRVASITSGASLGNWFSNRSFQPFKVFQGLPDHSKNVALIRIRPQDMTSYLFTEKIQHDKMQVFSRKVWKDEKVRGVDTQTDVDEYFISQKVHTRISTQPILFPTTHLGAGYPHCQSTKYLKPEL